MSAPQSGGAGSPINLFDYFRSSAAYRVRIGLALKGLSFQSHPVHLVRDGGQQLLPAYRAHNPLGLVPTFEQDDVRITQSLAILEYLEERHPAPALLPVDPVARARAREIALTIACDIHPLNNLRTLKYLTQEFGMTPDARQAWLTHWISEGFAALELYLAGGEGRYCVGDTPGLADCCLIPQMFNARRFNIDVSRYPRLVAIDAACNALPAFQAAHPSRQADAE
ncbi:maleylacetoacetate isomerase [Pigmentiphaga aceris]|uniref:Maleylacetoacetate isomerase n=1 Tax=Pigmentiphaga aceris TaxID=1940612 RepID=A0A5C0B3A8_9BURK|nr:maleylacetoacetate isomerase [Pigmentiphaga aceris]QEI08376.1 maleylacetoacetate isomerase [Pigmentiphaga aceris]